MHAALFLAFGLIAACASLAYARREGCDLDPRLLSLSAIAWPLVAAFAFAFALLVRSEQRQRQRRAR